MSSTDLLLLVIASGLSALYAVLCMQGEALFCTLRIKRMCHYPIVACVHAALTAFSVLCLQGKAMIILILTVNLLFSFLFFRTSLAFQLFAAGAHAYLFAASRIMVRSLLGIITGEKVAIFSDIGDPVSLSVPLCVLIFSYLLASVFITLVVSSVNKCRTTGVICTRRTLSSLVFTVFMLLFLTFIEASADTLYYSVRIFSLYHLVTCSLLTGALWQLFRYGTTVDLYTQNNRQFKEEQIEHRYAYYSTQAKYLEEYRSFRHDYKNQLAGLKVLVDSGEFGRASEYLNELTARFDVMQEHFHMYSDNMLADAVLQNLANRCKSVQASFEASVLIGNELPLSDLALSTLFSNLADNAFEAVETLEGRKRYISVTTSRREKWLIVYFENSFDGILKVGRDGYETRKKEKAFHGLGLQNIRGIVESVPGAQLRIEPDTEQGVFRVSLIFPRTPKKPKPKEPTDAPPEKTQHTPQKPLDTAAPENSAATAAASAADAAAAAVVTADAAAATPAKQPPQGENG